MTRLAIVTVARSDYGFYRPLLSRLAAESELEPLLIVAGMHLEPRFGNTIAEIKADGHAIAARVEMTLDDDGPGSIARSMGLGTQGFAEAFEDIRPEAVMVFGDRYEMHAAAAAAVPFAIPIVHINGGSLTLGAIDDSLRHSMTKLSHLHFVETELYRERVIQMGEAPWRVHVTGSLSLDNLAGFTPLTLDELNSRFGLALRPETPPLLVTFHPVTLEYRNTQAYVTALLAALAESGFPVVFTYPNADTNGRVIIEMIEDYAATRAEAACVPHFGVAGYHSLMAHAAAMVGNSSSGIMEAASFRLPVVDIGTRQGGRLAPENVLHTDYGKDAILAGIRTCTAPAYRKRIAGLVNPYGDGTAAEMMTAILKTTDFGSLGLIEKAFHEPDAVPA